MPNGHIDKMPQAELDEFFKPIAGALSGFGETHNLKLERYYHDAPSWDFKFQHPEGGVGKIEISRQADNKVSLSFMWWLDDYNTSQRYMKVSVQGDLAPEPGPIIHEMERGLQLVLSWKTGQWSKIYRGYDAWKTTWSKDEFVRISEQYPVPR